VSAPLQLAQPERHEVAGDGLGSGDAQVAASVGLQRREALVKAVGGAQQVGGPLGDDLPGLGRLRAAGAALKQVEAELVLELAHPFRHRLLRAVGGGSCGVDAAEFDDANEQLERVKVETGHRSTVSPQCGRRRAI
jgi:hypothetical protein